MNWPPRSIPVETNTGKASFTHVTCLSRARVGRVGGSCGRALLLPSQEMNRVFTAALGRLATLVFAAAIGENAPLVRAWICGRLGFLRFELNESHNAETAR